MGEFVSKVVEYAPMVLSAVGTFTQASGQQQSGVDYQQAANYNAAVYEQQSQIIEQKKELVSERYARLFRHLEGQSIAAVASSGYDFSGSFLEVVNDSLTQLELDGQLERYNLDVEKNLALSTANKEIMEGDMARQTGNTNALSTLLTQGNEWYQKYGGFGKSGSKSVVYPTDSVKPTVYDPKKGVVSGSYSKISGWGN